MIAPVTIVNLQNLRYYDITSSKLLHLFYRTTIPPAQLVEPENRVKVTRHESRVWHVELHVSLSAVIRHKKLSTWTVQVDLSWARRQLETLLRLLEGDFSYNSDSKLWMIWFWIVFWMCPGSIYCGLFNI